MDRVRNGARVTCRDRAAVEEPLEVRLHGTPFATLMRTPGADPDLVAGFLLSERVVRSLDDLGTIEHCRTPELRDAANVVNATLAGAAREHLDGWLASRRQVSGNASCGVCGRQTIDDLTAGCPPLGPGLHTTAAAVLGMPGALRREQAVFDDTGGLHAAGLFEAGGELAASAEDVGRHNAVDKVIGRCLLLDALPLSSRVLFVSGRTSFEIVQKALLAGIAIVASVSAPSSLAIELAGGAGITLVGFVRDGGFNVYTHPERVVT